MLIDRFSKIREGLAPQRIYAMRGSQQPPQRSVSWRGELLETGDTVILNDGRTGIFCYVREDFIFMVSIPSPAPTWPIEAIKPSEVETIIKKEKT